CNASGFCGQPSFCTQNGDACAHDEDCCGGICNPGPGGLGTCTTPSPGSTNCSAGVDGTVCTDCNGCCSRLCSPYGATGVKVCQLDALGVPRCYGLGTCRMVGETCSFSGDCCNGVPCTPDMNGILHCQAACSQNGNACTSSADCCNGLSCTFLPGSVQGTCGGM